jgi:hypothetical protein
LDEYPHNDRLDFITSLAGGNKKEKKLVENEIINLTKDSKTKSIVKTAMKVMDTFAAFPYSDAVSSLYKIRDILKFELFLVTEGDEVAQRWKLKKLGLERLFQEKNQIVERAFLSQEQFNTAFSKALIHPDSENGCLRKAQAICDKMQKTLKQTFRGRALYNCVKSLNSKNGSKRGVFVCTLGDRFDTDVIPYVKIRDGLCNLLKKQNVGFVVNRLERGPYANDLNNENSEKPDSSIKFFDELVQKIAKPGYWRNKTPIQTQDISKALPNVLTLSTDEYEILRMAANEYPEIKEIIDKLRNSYTEMK